MEPARYQRVTQIVADLLNLDTQSRGARLSALCGDDAPLRREVESLLKAHDAAGGFLLEPAYLQEDPVSQEQSPSLVEGRIIGPYQVLECIGVGGMGEVYRARDTRLHRDVALKALPQEFFGDAERLERLRHEARTLAALSHPNISVIYSIEEFADGICLALELVDGDKPEGPLPVDQAISYASQIAEAIEAAHEKGIVHRDLKPANIKVTPQGRVKVLDFGLAKVLMGAGRMEERRPERTPLSQTHSLEGRIVGTPPYLSPEQARGQPVDHRTDIWAFGCLLYELLTGKRAFCGETAAATISAILEREPDWTRIPAKTPAAVRELIRGCLRKETASRVQSMAEVRAALARGQRKSSPWRVAALAFVAVAAVTITALVAGRPGGVARTSPVEVKLLTSYSGAEQFPAINADGSAVAFVWTGVKNDQTDLYVRRIEGESPVRLTNDAALECYPSWSPDGTLIAFLHCDENFGGIRTEAEVYVAGSSPGAKRRVGKVSLQAYDNIPGLAWMPDGKHLVVRNRPSHSEPIGLFTLSIESGRMRQLTVPPKPYDDAAPAVSPDGRTLAFVRQAAAMRGDIFIQDLSVDGSSARRVTHDQVRIFGITWRSASDLIYLPERGTARRFWRVTTDGRQREPLAWAGQVGIQFSASRDGRRLIYSDVYIDTDIARVDLAHARKGRPLDAETLITSTQWDGSPQYSPDGKRIAFVSARSGHLELWVADADGSNPTQLTFWKRYTGSPRWSPGGDEIAVDSQDGGHTDIYVIDVNRREGKKITSSAGRNFLPSWSRDGKWVYFTSDRKDGRQVWKTLAHPVTGTGQATQITRSGALAGWESFDGKRFYYPTTGTPACVSMVPAEGGEETEVVCPLSSWIYLAMFRDGFYYAPRTSREVWFYNFADRQGREAFVMKGGAGGSFAVSPDRRWLLVSQIDLRRGDLYLVDNLN
ncbi:MAG: PD40 domain-containing protein [Bryobacterales bacterium]|nr:PD40 domain-containing protein [Bryobacterales bacterium]